MATLVGRQTEFSAALTELCKLDYDAIEAYAAAIERLKNNHYKKALKEFSNDHVRHTREISIILEKHNVKAPTAPSLKKLLTRGKVILASLLGDKAILKAMKTNEDDTNTAYERLNEHAGLWPDAKSILEKGLEDERRHRAWIEGALA